MRVWRHGRRHTRKVFCARVAIQQSTPDLISTTHERTTSQGARLLGNELASWKVKVSQSLRAKRSGSRNSDFCAVFGRLRLTSLRTALEFVPILASVSCS